MEMIMTDEVIRKSNFRKVLDRVYKRDVSRSYTYDEFCVVIKEIVEHIMENYLIKSGYNSNEGRPICKFDSSVSKFFPSNKVIDGKYVLTINEDVIKGLYDGNMTEFINLFYMLYHFKMHYDIKYGVVNYDTVRIVKEKLLMDNVKVKHTLFNKKQNELIDKMSKVLYLQNNSDLLSDNLYARIYALCDYLSLINYYHLSLHINDNDIENINLALNEYTKKYFNNERIIKKNKQNLCDSFDMIVSSHPEWVNSIPQLKIEYYLNEEGKVIKRSKEQLLNILSENVNYMDKEKIKYIEDLIYDKMDAKSYLEELGIDKYIVNSKGPGYV